MAIKRLLIEKVQEVYDLAAQDYAVKCFYELDYKPFDRSVLMRFSEMTRDM